MRVLLCFLVCCYGAYTIPVGKFLSILDKSLVYQIAHPNKNTNSVRFLIDDLRAYKDNLYRLTKRVSMGRGYVMEHARNLSLTDSPLFMKGFNIDFMKKNFNLTPANIENIKELISQIQSNWNQFMQVASMTEYSGEHGSMPYFLLDKSGNNLVELLHYPSPNKTAQLFTDLSNYYYSLGKLLKLFKLGQESVLEKARGLYELEKPVFLRRFINFKRLRYNFQLDEVQAIDVKRWISKILFRWKIFTSFYEINKDLLSKPNFNNFFQLQTADKHLTEILSEPKPENGYKLHNYTESFLTTLGLILRNNYKFREEVINRVREHYRGGPPLFLRKYISFKQIQTLFKLHDEVTFKIKKNVFRIRNRWSKLLGIDDIPTLPPTSLQTNVTDELFWNLPNRTVYG